MNSFKGWFGEVKSSFKMWLSLDSNIYHKFHNLIVPFLNGSSQIDHVIVSKYGVFIVETKNKKGWIFGSEFEPVWTQTIYQSKFKFQNPLRQTYRQKKVLANFLQIPESAIIDVVYFIGDCSFRTPMPPNVINAGLSSFIKSHRELLLTDQEMDKSLYLLKQLKQNSNITNRNHIKSLNDRYNSDTVCPKCGSALVERTARQGHTSGTKFLGCSSYPKCRFTKAI